MGISPYEKSSKTHTEQELQAIDRMKEVSFKDPATGKWQTEFLWKNTNPEFRKLSDNTASAKAIMRRVESQKVPTLKALVKDAYHTLINKTYVERVPDDEINTKAHPVYVMNSDIVFNLERLTTKARIVSNASRPCKVTKMTLNKMLMPGPNLLPQVMEIVLVAGEPKYIFTIDIKKMFFQVQLWKKSDRDMVRFYYGDFTGEEVLYRYCVLPFGAVSSPFQALWCLHETARQNQAKYPEAAKVILNYLYMDDICTGANTVAETVKLLHDILFIINDAGFEGHKISSNKKEVLDSLSDELKHEADDVKLLGIRLSLKEDKFYFDLEGKFVNFDQNASFITRRQCVSLGAQVFDTQGYVAPFIMMYKQILPEMWAAAIKWDDNLLDIVIEIEGVEHPHPAAQHAVQVFKTWVSQIPLLKQLSFPRWIGGPIQFIATFCDASKKGIAACVYIVALTEEGSQIYPTLRYSKSALMPKNLRPGALLEDAMTIARAELAAMKIAVTVGQYVAKAVSWPFDRICYFSDSLLNLQRLQREPEKSLRWEFNRLKFILANIDGGVFRFVPGKLNPADLPSRGCDLRELIEQKDFWIHGPDFLKQPQSEWPKQPVVANQDKSEDTPEVAKFKTCFSAQRKVIRAERILQEKIDEAKKWHKPIIDYLSTYSKLYFIIGLIITFLRTKKIMSRHKGPGKIFRPEHIPEMKAQKTLREYKLAENILVKYAQEDQYMKEIFVLRKRAEYDNPNDPEVLAKHPLHKDSRLRHFTCYYDKAAGLIRLGTRLVTSKTSPSLIARPILLPQGRVAELLIMNAHLVNRHMTQKHTWAYIRERYWLQGGRTYVQHVIRTCMAPKCKTPRL